MSKDRVYNPDKQKTIEQAYFERILKSVLENLGGLTMDSVEDVSQNPEYFKKDIDVLINGVSYEFKMDRYDTGYCFLETISNTRTGALGWLFVSQAKWLIYAFPEKGVAYVSDMKVLREWFLDNINWYIENDQMKRVTTDNQKGYKYFSYGFLVGLKLLEDERIFKKFNLIPV